MFGSRSFVLTEHDEAFSMFEQLCIRTDLIMVWTHKIMVQKIDL